MKESIANLKTVWRGLINWGLGKRLLKVMNKNLDYLAPVYKQLYDFDLVHFLNNVRGIHEIDEINWRICKSKNLEEYQTNYSCGNHMEKIKVPTLFFYCEDDPIVNRNCIEHEKAIHNDNILIASTKYGAHLCQYEHFFKISQWITKPPFEFFNYFKNTKIDTPETYESTSNESIDEFTELTQYAINKNIEDE